MTLFPTNTKNIGIILKGKSIEKIDKVYNKYDHSIFVNNFDLEYKKFRDYFIGKHSIQLVNRLNTAVCKKKVYQDLNIKDVMMCKPKEYNDPKIERLTNKYRKRGLNINYVPKECMTLAKHFGPKDKYTNTGILAFVYTIQIVKPKHVWAVGLDFYQSDYLFRRKHQNPLVRQQKKMKDRNTIENFIEHILKPNPDIMFHIVSYYDWPKLDNVEII